MAKTLRIMSYNGTGLGDLRLEYIEDLLNSQNVDILLIQESWLLSKTMYKLGNIHKDYIYCGVSGVDENELLTGRPYGGLAILWKREFGLFIKPV